MLDLLLSRSLFVRLTADEGLTVACFLHSDLSDQIKAATKDSHVRAENTQLMLSYQKGQITPTQYKVKLQKINTLVIIIIQLD